MSKPAASRQVSSIDFAALSVHANACIHELIDRGYAERTIDRYRCALDHFSHWVSRARGPWNGEEESVRRFLSSHHQVCDYVTAWLSPRRWGICFVSCEPEGTSFLALVVRPRSKRKCNALIPILSGSVASPLKPARCERISFVDSYARAFRAAQSTSAIAVRCKFADLLWTLWKDGGPAPSQCSVGPCAVTFDFVPCTGNARSR